MPSSESHFTASGVLYASCSVFYHRTTRHCHSKTGAWLKHPKRFRRQLNLIVLLPEANVDHVTTQPHMHAHERGQQEIESTLVSADLPVG